MPKKITVAHSPDSDDAFMFWAMSHGKVPTGDYEVNHVLADIETLNQRAKVGTYEVTAFSMHAYAYLTDKYSLMSCGASMGDGYGPVVVAKPELDGADVNDLTVGIPGERTTAFLALRLYYPDVKYKVMPFDEITDRVLAGEVDAGLVIHEGQLTYEEEGLVKIMDVGEIWLEETGLPLPLGGNGVRRDLPLDEQKELTEMVRRSIEYALDHREAALRYAEQFGRGLKDDKTDKFVGMYVNELTVDYGDRGRRAVQELMTRASEKGLIPTIPNIEFI